MKVISFGAGKQSTALLVMSALGLGDCPKADYAIFADTGSEPKWVYENLEFYREWAQGKIPVVTVSAGNLLDDLRRKASGNGRFVTIPAFTGGDGDGGMLRRQCTREYKIEPIQKEIRRLLGYKHGERVKDKVTVMLGISLDEVTRVKPNRVPWMENVYPLIDARMARGHCVELLQSLSLPVPKKSSCVFCPYHDDGYWRDLQVNHPDEFKVAVEADELGRNMTKGGIHQPAYVHRSLRPLATIDFAENLELFDNECEGYCGV